MNGIRDLVKSIFIDAGMPKGSIEYEPYLPGFYRPRKRWDMAVKYKGALVAALEFKSQVGSVGKNINNRFEEALGTGTDTWAAQAKLGAYGEVPPWLGYVFVLREDEETEWPDRPIDALFPADRAFRGMSYNQRYQQMLRRFHGRQHLPGRMIYHHKDRRGRPGVVCGAAGHSLGSSVPGYGAGPCELRA